MSRGDVVVLINENRQHTVVSLGGSRFIEASGTKRRVIIVDMNKAHDRSYPFLKQSERLQELFNMPYTVYDINWPQ